MLSKYFPLLIALSFAIQSYIIIGLMKDIRKQNKDILYLMKNQNDIYSNISELYELSTK